MVDYKKWDKFANDINDSEGEEEALIRPQVTKLEAPSRVTINKSGVTISTEAFPTSSIKTGNVMSSESEVPSSWSLNGACNTFNSMKIYWSQSKDEVVIRCEIGSTIKGKDLRVSFYPVLNDSNGKPLFKLFRITCSSTLIIEGQMQYDIVAGSDGSYEIEWEIITYNKIKYIEITNLRKKSIAGTFIWWDRLFISDVPIDLTAIEGRIGDNSVVKQAWNEAHRMFREKVQNITPNYIDGEEI